MAIYVFDGNVWATYLPPVLSARPSRTALGVAVHRAQHQLFDCPLVFQDPCAVPIVGDETADALRCRRVHDAWSRAMRAFVVARSRCAEDALDDAVARGVRQYVILGAGLETFAYRSSTPTLRVFEVDHPATQEWKRERLRAGNIVVPDTVRFAPVDFTRDDLTEGLGRAGFDFTKPAFVSWLGVTPYLEEHVALDTLRTIAGWSAESGVTFDYMIDRAAMTPLERLAFAALGARVAALGEPLRGTFQPERLKSALSAMGFTAIDDLDREALNCAYFRGRTDGLRVCGAGRVMTAWKR